MVRHSWIIVAASVFVAGCVPAVRRDQGAAYSVSVRYSNRSFTDEAFSGQSVLILPVLTAQGPSRSAAMSARRLSAMVHAIRPDLRLSDPEEFEKNYLATYDMRSLADFYRQLYGNDVVKTETSDSVWKTIHAAYCFVAKLKYAAAIRGFDGNIRKRLGLEAEIWDVVESEAVWRIEVKGFDDGIGRSDDQFVAGALSEIFIKLPGRAEGNNEKDW